MQRKPNKLTLTAPKEPEFETAQRVRPTTVKSSAELEEEMMAKIPKFKARPLNKKVIILQRVLCPLPTYFEYFLSILSYSTFENRYWKLQSYQHYLKVHRNFQNLRYGYLDYEELRGVIQENSTEMCYTSAGISFRDYGQGESEC